MADPNYGKPITSQQVNLAKAQRDAVLRRSQSPTNKPGNPVINQQDLIARYGARPRDYLKDPIGTWKRDASDFYSFIPSLQRRLFGGSQQQELNQKQAIDRYLNFSKTPQKYLIPEKATGNQLKKRYQEYKQDAQRAIAAGQQGVQQPTYSKFLAFNTPDTEKERIQAGTNTDILPIMAARLQVYKKRNQLTQLIKNAPDQMTRRVAHQQLLQLGKAKEEIDQQYDNLRPIDKFRYYFTPMGTTALAAPVVAKMAPSMLAFQGVRRYVTSPAANKITGAITAEDVALGNAMVTGNTYLLSPQLKAKLKEKQTQLGLPELDNNPANRQLWALQGKKLLDRAGTWKKGGQVVADLIPMALSPQRMLEHGIRAGWRTGTRYGVKKGLQAVPTALKHGIKKSVTSPGIVGGVQGTASFGLGGTPSVSAQHQVINGQAPVQQYKQQLEQQGIAATPENVIALHKATKAQQDALESSLNGKMGDFAVKLGEPWIRSAVDKEIKDRLAFAGLSEQDMEKNFPQFIRKQQAAQQDPMKQIMFQKWRQSPQSREFVKKQLSQLKPQQYRQLFNLNKKRAQKQGAYLPSKIAQDNNDWLTAVGMQAAMDNYKKDLAEQNFDKFFSNMQQWMPLVNDIGGAEEGSALKQATKKAVWAHVKKNPFSINKAMSLWALSNGYNSLGSFLGSNGAFYGTLVGLPLTIALVSSLFGGSRQVQQQAPRQYQPVAYAPRGITERGLIVG